MDQKKQTLTQFTPIYNFNLPNFEISSLHAIFDLLSSYLLKCLYLYHTSTIIGINLIKKYLIANVN